MSDPTEAARRERLVEINVVPGSREALKRSTARSGDRPACRRLRGHRVHGPPGGGRRKSDGQKGSLEFQHGPPRLYFNFEPHNK